MRAMYPDPAVLRATLEATANARQVYADGGEPLYFPMIPGPEVENVMEALKEAPDYYFDDARGAHPRWENKMLSWSLEKLMCFSSLEVLDLVSPHPILFIVGSKSASRTENEQSYAAAQEPKELFLVDGASHIDLYDRNHYVKPVADKLAAFFRMNL